ncbi:MAG TPA: ribosome biogenesis GTPase Der [bacterium]|nr:ribosome biogenesis GTPase Der [bacterium]
MVSIIGRPNVGKSTLFNRIVRRREAIVDDMPGVTRDRKSFPAEWEGRSFAVADTGGYIPKTQDTMEKGVTRQVQAALEQADVVLFVADCTTGITQVDAQVACLIQKSGKPCVLAVNKTDNEKREPEAAGFIHLGLGEPVPVSALSGRGVGDLLSEVVKRLPEESASYNSETDPALRLAVVGKPNVGKSTFINTLLGEERLLVTEIPGTTRDSVDVKIRFGNHEVVLIDTAGLRKPSRVKEGVEYYSGLRTRQTIESCDVACVFIDAAELLTQQDQRVLSEVIEQKKGVLLVVNKWDLVQGDAYNVMRLKDSLSRRLESMSFVPLITISCLTGLRVYKVMKKVLEVWESRRARIPPKELNRFLAEANKAYQPPAVGGKRVRIHYVTQIGSAPPRFAFFANHPSAVREAYRRYLDNRIRDAFGFEGVPLTLLFKKK